MTAPPEGKGKAVTGAARAAVLALAVASLVTGTAGRAAGRIDLEEPTDESRAAALVSGSLLVPPWHEEVSTQVPAVDC